MKMNCSVTIPAGNLAIDKESVLAIARDWYDADLVRVNTAVISSLRLPSIPAGAEAGMLGNGIHNERAGRLARSIALNSLNFQFWDMQEGVFTRYSHNGIVGAMGMRDAFETAWDDPAGALAQARQGLRSVDAGLVIEVFGDIPEVQSRVAVLQDILAPGKLEQLCDSLNETVTQEQGYDTRMAAKIADTFPVAYGDPVLKKAQLALSEVWVQDNALNQKVYCDLTAFADYQIPNVLRALGVLEYGNELARSIEAQELLPFGGREECAIRAASLLAVEEIARANGVPVAAVDHYLWTRRKEAKTPFHLTVTTAY